MKKQYLVCLIFLLSVLTMSAQKSNNKYENDWKKVENFEDEGLPQSAMKAVDTILQKAIVEKNNTQVVKALIYKNKYKITLDQNDNMQLINDLLSLVSQTNDVSEKSLLYSMLAELYYVYYNNDRWNIRERTALEDMVPGDIKEWTENIFINKITESLELSVKDKDILKTHTTKDYNDIILSGTVSERYYPTLYDFLMLRTIIIAKKIQYMRQGEFDASITGYGIEELGSPAKDYVKLNINLGADKKQIVFLYYQQYLKDLLERSLTPTTIIMDLDRINYLRSIFYSFSNRSQETYLALYNEYQENETSVEIIDKIIDSYSYTRQVQSEVNKEKYEWLQKGIAKYPDYYAIDILKDRVVDMEIPIIRLNGEQYYHPKNSIKVDLLYKNPQAFDKKPEFKLYKSEGGEYKIIKEYPLNLISKTTYNEDTLKIDLGVLPVGRYRFTAYDSVVDDTKEDEKFDFVVSALTSFYTSSTQVENEYEIFVVDRITGKPQKDVTVIISPDNEANTEFTDSKPDIDTKPIILKTDEMGLVRYKYDINDQKRNSTISYKIEAGADSCLVKIYIWRDYPYKEEENNSISIFTDRSIYRPGQTVYFKAITLGKDSKPLTKEEQTVELYDANDELVSEKDLTTNEFGSIFGEFTLPKSGLLGQYYIEVDDQSVYFSVEEYKRPTFEVTFDKLENTYAFGDEVTLKGHVKNFSGVSLQDAEVKYTIIREQFSFWSSGSRSQFAQDTVRTKADGSFEISFVPQPGDGMKTLWRNDKNIYVFNITATVTDMNGETQSNNYSLSVGNVSMVMDIEVPDKIEKSSDYKLNIVTRNLEAQDIKTTGSYTLFSLDENDSIKSKILEGTFESGEQIALKNKLKSQSSGKYRLELKALDDKQREVTSKGDFILFSYNDKKPPIKTNEWLVEKNTVFTNKKPAEIIYGTTDKETYVLYRLYNNDKVFDFRYIKLNNSNHTFTIPYKEEYGDKVNFSLYFQKEGKAFSRDIPLTKEKEKIDDKLNIKLEVFRDKLRPGQEETWTISVKDTTDAPVTAELLASMYDISLDKLSSYSPWTIDRPLSYDEYIRSIYYRRAAHSYTSHYPRILYTGDKQGIKGLNRTIDAIDWFEYFHMFRYSNIWGNFIFNSAEKEFINGVIVAAFVPPRKISSLAAISKAEVSDLAAPVGNLLGGRVAGLITKQESADSGEEVPEFWVRGTGIFGVNANSSALVFIDGKEGNINDVNPEDIESFSVLKDTGIILITTKRRMEPEIRKNFNETAFFYPQLRTNEKGETLISFTVPESNTTWRFRALAHDKEARVGTLEQMVYTRKELMVTPNMPRFVRQGDRTSISTKISNLSENAVSGDVHIEFFNPVTDEIIDLGIADQKQTFSVEKDASTSVSWTFDIPLNLELIGCRIVAQNDTFSDGEQHVLAILSNRMMVTESMPIDITQSGTSTFIFDKLNDSKSTTAENYSLTLEYASNPAWYAVQALPSMANPTNENAINWFASYYVNTLGTSIVRQYPKVASMIQAWLQQGGDKETLISKLQKDEELKAVLLEETPWVLDAKTETEQMQRLSMLFDLNNTKQLTDAATRKLKELQNNEGGWAWYKGFYPSRSITQYILYGYAMLQQTGQVEYPEEVKIMQMNALRYIDKQLLNDFNSLKKNNKDWEKITTVSSSQLEFAYVRSFYRDIPIDQETRKVERFYTDVASKNWTKLSMYQRSILSVLLRRNGDKELANKIAKSIKEHAVNDKKLGMYWPNNRSNVFFSMSAISTHTFLMDALRESGATEKEKNDMKRWLLNQKQTQVWESNHATIDAINTILSTGSDWFHSSSTKTTIKVGNQNVEQLNKELGTGYFKKVWAKESVDNNMAKVEVTTPSSDPAYGALYWQYYEDLDKITAQSGELNVEKQLFKENITDAGKSLVRITPENHLTIGDKVVVRLTIKVDRDMEFVQLKDMRAPCFEPEQTVSGTKWANSLIYYQMPKDASTNFYFDRLPKGTYVLEYPVYVNRSGEYSNGITTIQCMYAPQFISHTQGVKVIVKEK